MFSFMGNPTPRYSSVAPSWFPVRLSAEPQAAHYVASFLPSDRSQAFVEGLNAATFIYLPNVREACRLTLSCLRLIGCVGADFPVSSAGHGGEHYSVRLTVGLDGVRGDRDNRLTQAFFAQGQFRYHIRQGILNRSGARVAYVHLPTLWEAVCLVKACPHVRLVGDERRARVR